MGLYTQCSPETIVRQLYGKPEESDDVKAHLRLPQPSPGRIAGRR